MACQCRSGRREAPTDAPYLGCFELAAPRQTYRIDTARCSFANVAKQIREAIYIKVSLGTKCRDALVSQSEKRWRTVQDETANWQMVVTFEDCYFFDGGLPIR
jgi:hypothetical protein